MKTLIVDDDQIVLDSCRRILMAEGYEVYLVRNADKVQEVLENNTFDLLILDVKMPAYDGMDLMRQIKDKWPGLPIILMSGYSTPETMVKGVQRGAAQFIAKPFTPEELIAIVRKVMKKGT